MLTSLILYFNIANAIVEAGLEFNYLGARKDRWVMLGVGGQLKNQINDLVGILPVNEEIFRGHKFSKITRLFAIFYSTPFEFLTFQLEGEYGRKIYRGIEHISNRTNIKYCKRVEFKT